MIYFNIYEGERETGTLLAELVKQEIGDIQVPDVCVCWGQPGGRSLPTLNKNAGYFNKLTQMRLMRDAGVRHVPFYVPVPAHGNRIFPAHFPIVARNVRHTGGTDVIVCSDETAVRDALHMGRAFFTLYIKALKEYRFWVFRSKCLGAYVKVRTRPSVSKLPAFVANYQNGYSFYRVEAVPEKGAVEAVKAVRAVGLDFGAVDVLVDAKGTFYVLEVNSAPGVQTVQSAIRNLAKEIVVWAEGQK